MVYCKQLLPFLYERLVPPTAMLSVLRPIRRSSVQATWPQRTQRSLTSTSLTKT